MRTARMALVAALAVVLIGPVASPDAVALRPSGPSPAASGADAGSLASGSPAARRWAPPDGAMLSNPEAKNRRKILRRILRSVRSTPKGEFVRIAVWNWADRHATDTLIRAKKRGVRVQVITAGTTDSGPWKRLKRFLSRNKRDKNWAIKCRGACRSLGNAMHMKFALFSRIRWKRNISMVGSWNITKAAANRQWNDNVTQSNYRLYRGLLRTFTELRQRRNAKPHPTNYRPGRYHLQLWPVYNQNPINSHLQKVRCWNNGHRTRIRVAIATWAGEFGDQVARTLRRKWNRGCNIRVLVTMTGSNVNRIMKRRGGRGPVPMKSLVRCCHSGGVPTKYLHLKAVAIAGNYGGNKGSRVLLTGSPNWSQQARKADENVLRIFNSGAMVKKYIRHINRWYRSGAASRSAGARSGPTIDAVLQLRDDLPDWFELQ